MSPKIKLSFGAAPLSHSANFDHRTGPRGSAAASRTAHSEFNRNHAPATDRSSCQQTAAMSMLRSSNHEKHAPENFLMQ